MVAGGARRAVARGVVEHEHLTAERLRVALGRDGVEAAHEQLALLGVDHAEGQLDLGHRGATLSRTRENADMDDEAGLRGMYDAFNARDIDAVLAAMTDDVDWPNGWEGGRELGREAVREYWTRQWAAIDPSVEVAGMATRPTAPSPWTSSRSSATSTARSWRRAESCTSTRCATGSSRGDIEEGDAGHS